MGLQLQATDLLLVNRGGTNYKVTGADVRAGALQSADLLMVQRGGTLYKLVIADIRNQTNSFQSTDFLLVQRGDEMYALNPQTIPDLAPHITISGNNSGVDSTKRAISIKWTGAQDINGIKPQIRFESSLGINTYYFGDHGDTWYTPSQLGSGDWSAKIFGSFTYFAFGASESLGLVSVAEATAGAINLMVSDPADNWGEDLFALSPKLTTVPTTMKLKSMARTFSGCSVFNQDISALPDTNKITSFERTFENCIVYNKTLATWLPIASDSFRDTFSGCTVFNQPLNSWGPGMINASTCYGMFRNCAAFQRPLDQWTFGVNMTIMTDMFSGATIFNQDLSGWCVTNIASEPFNFAYQSELDNNPSNKPVWGSCP